MAAADLSFQLGSPRELPLQIALEATQAKWKSGIEAETGRSLPEGRQLRSADRQQRPASRGFLAA